MESKRERKPTTFFKTAEPAKKVVAEIAKGSGITLGENEYFCHELGKFKADSDLVKMLHRLLFGTVSSKQDAKKRIRQFSGFPEGTSRDDKVAEVSGKKLQWTVALLKDALGTLGLEKSGNRDVIVERLIDYLVKPSETKSVPAASSSTGKRKTTSSSSKGKKTKKTKVSRPPTAYMLYVKEHSPAVRQANPDIGFGEVSKLVGQQWSALSDKDKELWNIMAADAKIAFDNNAASKNKKAADGDDAGAEDEEDLFKSSDEDEEEAADQADEGSEHEHFEEEE